jgi:hypothetical protein
MNKLQHLFLSLLLIVLSMHAYAEIFSCRDGSGRLITSDRAISECAGKTTGVYTNSGVLKHYLPGPLTPEQRHAAELQEQQRIKLLQQEVQNQKEIRYLTTHYPTEQDIEIARQKELDAVDAKIAEEKKTIAVTTEALNKHRHEQTRLSKQSNSNLVEAQNDEDQLEQTIQASEHMIQRYLVEKTNINRRFDETHQRYLKVVRP